ncbi:DUF1648 domain-containing protein [Leifsonia sp. NPDC080035]|uniref:DUF1648 domain-containing protein n=1 Tax=Leifsonia sp. NPDC080035 TaxID=3143936 RepID=A0AAU7GGC1_9MICO
MAARDAAVRRFVLVCLGVPAALTAAALVVQLLLLPSLPDPVATHWGPSGAADRFGPAWITPLITVLVGLGAPALIALTALPGMRRGGRGPSYRFLGAFAPAVTTVVAVLGTGTLLQQAGLQDAHDAPAVWAPLVAAFACAIPVGVACWYLQPAVAAPTVQTQPTRPLPLAGTERAVWLGETSIQPVGGVLIGAATVIIIVAAVATWLFGDQPGAAWALTAIALLLLALAACTLVFRVRVDASGLTVSSIAGFPRFHVPLQQIASARATTVEPMGEFGGWGIRSGLDGRFGIVLRRGAALEAERTDGRRFVVTVAGADTAAALLQALVERDRSAAGS